MSGKSSPGLAGLIVEGAIIGLVVTLLPKLPLGSLSAAPSDAIADQRPSMAPALRHDEPLRWRPPNWRTAVSQPEPSVTLPRAETAYVEDRLDEAGEQLVGGLATYLTQHVEEILATPAETPLGDSSPDQNSPRARSPLTLTPPEFPRPSSTPRFTPRNAYRY